MDTDTSGPQPAPEHASFRRILLIACLGSALGGMLIAGVLSSLERPRAHCPCPYSSAARGDRQPGPAGFTR